ncbi:GntR family transcriptional regulator [Acetobacter sp.]|uniref:GntR family transcriptional regulator n=1 Tax=Acetobacter sp. TaxID=440 RepID=UPI0039EB0E87
MISQSDQAVERLQSMIEQGTLQPGSMVSERGLMELTGLGRTPVREAIQRLALNRMLRIHPSRGIEVPPVSVEDQLSGLEVRRATELLAITLACERATEKDIDDIRALADLLDGDFPLPQYTQTVRQTHALIVRVARNPYLDALMSPLQALSRRFWLMHIRDEASEIKTGKALHQRILLAIAARDLEAASCASTELNDYLVQYALHVVAKRAAKPK